LNAKTKNIAACKRQAQKKIKYNLLNGAESEAANSSSRKKKINT
jgi:hypothetical protein